MLAPESTILIADDAPFMRQLLKNILQDFGFKNFTECSDGQQCLESIQKIKPTIIFLDIVMPEMSGLDVLKQCGNDVDIVMITAIGQDQVIEEALQAGAKGFIIKPFEKEQIKELIEKL